jgi:hypothetical protein
MVEASSVAPAFVTEAASGRCAVPQRSPTGDALANIDVKPTLK